MKNDKLREQTGNNFDAQENTQEAKEIFISKMDDLVMLP